MKTGKKRSITNKLRPEDEMNYYYLSHDFGYIFVFENNSDTMTLDEFVCFTKLVNLKLNHEDSKTSNGEPFWKFTVPPNRKVFKHLRRIEVNAAISMSYKVDHEFLQPKQREISVKEKLAPETLSEGEIVEIIKNRGTKRKFK